ncbi:MAG: hypothetical protein P1U46_01135 [Patescibacteria group bacterium]|nr:hypothetical protein [Patescibacteria group bacterium]
MLTFSLFKSVRAEYKVVDLPDQVGQDVKITPFGRDIAFFINSRFLPSIHNSNNLGICLDLSTILITTFSQLTVGKVETLKSRLFQSIVVLILPSCGTLDSSIFKSDIILNLATIHECIKFWYSSISLSSQSSLYLSLTKEVSGSKCISEDHHKTAAKII